MYLQFMHSFCGDLLEDVKVNQGGRHGVQEIRAPDTEESATRADPIAVITWLDDEGCSRDASKKNTSPRDHSCSDAIKRRAGLEVN